MASWRYPDMNCSGAAARERMRLSERDNETKPKLCKLLTLGLVTENTGQFLPKARTGQVYYERVL